MTITGTSKRFITQTVNGQKIRARIIGTRDGQPVVSVGHQHARFELIWNGKTGILLKVR